MESRLTYVAHKLSVVHSNYRRLTRYVPGGKYTVAGLTVDDPQLLPHRFPSLIARFMASVSSVLPSPRAP